MASRSSWTFRNRQLAHNHPVAKKLFEIAESKNTNLVVSADMHNTQDLLDLAEAVGPYIAVLKTHIDMVSDFNDTTVTGLKMLKEKYNFLIFEDRKFVDIGATVQKQYHGGALRISEWADIVNASVLAGPDTIRALSEEIEKATFKASIGESRAILLLAEMTTRGTLACGNYTTASVQAARDNLSSVIGFVAMGSLEKVDSDNPVIDEDMVLFTTGINASSRSDELGQTYQTPEEAVARGADFVIVGRGIYNQPENQMDEVKRYRDRGWAAYRKTLGTKQSLKELAIIESQEDTCIIVNNAGVKPDLVPQAK